ncbi:hypothetical protein BDV10DRAFT_27473 [Aspergillus recurvatus]
MEPRFFAGSEAGDWTCLGIAADFPCGSDTILQNNHMASELEPEMTPPYNPEDVDIFRWPGTFDPQHQLVDSREPAIAQSTDAEQLNHQSFFDPQQPL